MTLATTVDMRFLPDSEQKKMFCNAYTTIALIRIIRSLSEKPSWDKVQQNGLPRQPWFYWLYRCHGSNCISMFWPTRNILSKLESNFLFPTFLKILSLRMRKIDGQVDATLRRSSCPGALWFIPGGPRWILRIWWWRRWQRWWYYQSPESIDDFTITDLDLLYQAFSIIKNKWADPDLHAENISLLSECLIYKAVKQILSIMKLPLYQMKIRKLIQDLMSITLASIAYGNRAWLQMASMIYQQILMWIQRKTVMETVMDSSYYSLSIMNS